MRWTLGLSMLLTAVQATSPQSWTLHHAIIDASGQVSDFTVRGKMTLSLKTDNSKDNSSATKPVGVKENSPFELTLESGDSAVTPQFVQSLLEKNAFYQLKLVPDKDPNALPVITTVSACEVRRANFR